MILPRAHPHKIPHLIEQLGRFDKLTLRGGTHIVSLHEMGEIDGKHFLVYPFNIQYQGNRSFQLNC
jgi:hypothetical protein